MTIRTRTLPNTIKRILAESVAEQSDRQLLGRFEQSGDEAAFASLVDRHGPLILGLCRRLTDSVDLADDVFQATFLLLARKSRTILRRESLASWLCRVARSLARQARLAEDARSRRERTVANQSQQASSRDASWDELLRILDEELQRLPERCRAPLLLCYLEGRTQDEAAKQLGWSLSTLRRRLESGRELLRSQMTRRGATLGAALFAGILAPSALNSAIQQSVVGSAVSSGQANTITPLALELVKGAMRMTVFAKIGKCVAFTLVLSGALACAAWEMGIAHEPETPPAPKKSNPLPEPATEARSKEIPTERKVLLEKNASLPKGALARLGSNRFRHGGWPYGSPAFSSDGLKLASASLDAVYVFEAKSGKILHHIPMPEKHHPRIVRFLDDKRIAVASADWQHSAEVNVHNLADGKVTASSKFQTTKSQIFVIDFNADASQILVEDRFAKVFLWDVKTKQEIWSFEHPEAAFTLPFTADGKRFVLAQSRKAELRDAASGKVVAEFPDPGAPFTSFYEAAAISTDGKLAIAARDATSIAVLDLHAQPDIRVLETGRKPGGKREQYNLAFSPNSQYLIAVGRDSTLVWDLAAKEKKGLAAKLPAAISCGFSQDGKTLALDDIGYVTLFRAGEWKMLPQSADPSSLVNIVRFAADGKQVLAYTRNGWLRWPAAGGPATRLSTGGLSDGDVAADISADGRVAAEIIPDPDRDHGQDDKSTLRVTDLSTAKTSSFPLDVNPWSIKLSSEGRYVSAHFQRELVVWDANTGKVRHQEKLPKSERVFFCVDSTPDGNSLARSVSGVWRNNGRLEHGVPMYKAVHVTDHRTGNEWEMNPLPWSIYSEGARFSPDGARLITLGHFDGNWKQDNVSVWDVKTGRRLLSWPRKGGRLGAVALSADGRSLLVGDDTGHLGVVELATGSERAQFRHGSEICSAAFDPTGLRVAASSPEAPVYVWDLAGQSRPWDSAKADAIWADLASTDAKAGFAAIVLLRSHPAKALPLLRNRVQIPAVPAKKTIVALLEELDSPEFAVREKAQKELTSIADLVRMELAEALKGNVSPEVRERLEKVLKSTETMTAERIRQTRVCEVLEAIATPDAAKLLRAWSAGPDTCRLTIEANESLGRMGLRQN